MLKLAAACVASLMSVASTNEKIWVLDGDLGDSYDALQFADRYPTRFIMAGIAEQNMVTMAAGMASCGLRPWVFSFAAFLVFRAADQIRVSIAQTNLPVVLIGSHAGGCGGRNGKSHQALNDLAYIGSLPAIDIWTPCDAKDVDFAVKSILASETPAYIRTPRDMVEELPGNAGHFRMLTQAAPMLMLASGYSAHWAVEISRMLETVGVKLAVANVGYYSQVSDECMQRISAATKYFVIEDHVLSGGLAETLYRTTSRWPDEWYGWPGNWPGSAGSTNELRSQWGLDTDNVVNSILQHIPPAIA